MPAVRKELLPAGDFLHNPFFDPEVQNILKWKRTLPAKCPKRFQSFLLAWPLLVFEISGELAAEVSDIERHSDWLYCYKLDRQFSSELLAAITRFVELPRDKWDLRRALMEFANTASEEFSEAVISGETIEQTPHGLFHGSNRQALWEPLMAWKDVASHIEVNCPHLKNVWLSGERLRKKEFYEENQRRKAILRQWQPNFTALWDYGRTQWYERMPCLPA